VTTHSPYVISQVRAAGVTVIEPGGGTHEPLATFGLPAEEISETVQGVPPEHAEKVSALMQALDDFEVERAEELLKQISEETELPNTLVLELETLIGNTKALLDDAVEAVSEAGEQDEEPVA